MTPGDEDLVTLFPLPWREGEKGRVVTMSGWKVSRAAAKVEMKEAAA